MKNTTFEKNNNFFAVLAFIAEKSGVSVRDVASALNMSRSTTLRRIEDLLSIGIISEFGDNGTRRFSVTASASFFVFDLTLSGAELTVYSWEGAIIHRVKYVYDGSRLMYDDLLIFLRECRITASRKGLHADGYFVLLPEGGLPINEAGLTSLFTTVLGTEPDYIMSEIRCTCELCRKGGDEEMTVTASGQSVYGILSEGRHVRLRTADKECLLRGASTSKAAADIAISLAHTITLLNVTNVTFDSHEILGSERFTDEFLKTLTAFLGGDLPRDIKVIQSKTRLSHIGAASILRKELLCKLLLEAERNRENELLPD